MNTLMNTYRYVQQSAASLLAVYYPLLDQLEVTSSNPLKSIPKNSDMIVLKKLKIIPYIHIFPCHILDGIVTFDDNVELFFLICWKFPSPLKKKANN